MPQNISPTPEVLGPVSVPSSGDPRDSGPLRAIFQKLLNMIAGVVQVASPSGTVAAFAGPVAPSGWLLCNGQAVSRTDYAALYAAIGTTFGAGNTTTTFNVPDLRGRVVLGVGQGPSLTNRLRGDTGGEEAHALTLQELPAHSHKAPTPGSSLARSGTLELPKGASEGGGYADADFVNAAATETVGGNGAHNTLPPFLALNYIIRS